VNVIGNRVDEKTDALQNVSVLYMSGFHSHIATGTKQLLPSHQVMSVVMVTCDVYT